MKTFTYDRLANQSTDGAMRSGVVGQMSMRRLCELIEASSIKPPEKITHLEIDGLSVRFRIERA